ncbi:hypothetical protein LINPERPRIM_LOCUS31932 [Linum perenne]
MSITRSSFLQSAGVHAVQVCTPCRGARRALSPAL